MEGGNRGMSEGAMDVSQLLFFVQHVWDGRRIPSVYEEIIVQGQRLSQIPDVQITTLQT